MNFSCMMENNIGKESYGGGGEGKKVGGQLSQKMLRQQRLRNEFIVVAVVFMEAIQVV